MGTGATIVALFPTPVEQQSIPNLEARLKRWLGRRRAPENHPGLRQVDRLLSGRPDELEVPISGLPGQLGEVFALYEGLFELRDYRVMAVDRRLDDLWIARLARVSN